jgi:flagellar hook-basal body complex protein FliE
MVAPIGGVAPLPPLPPITPADRPGAVGGAAAPGFGEALGKGLQQVSSLEHRADALIEDVATGGPTRIHEVMAATSQAGLAVDLLVQVRDRALEAYQEVMRLQV